MKLYAAFLRVSLCLLALQNMYIACGGYSMRPRGIRRSIVATPEERAAYKERRARETEHRLRVFGQWLDTDNLEESARKFVIAYELPDWNRLYTGDQINAMIKQVHTFFEKLRTLYDTSDYVGILKAIDAIPPTIPSSLKEGLRKELKQAQQEARDMLANKPLEFVATTANILGIFNDPFEFAGDYGEMEHIRQQVFEALVSSEAFNKGMSEEQFAKLNLGTKKEGLARAIAADKEYGPTLGEVVTSDLFSKIAKKLASLKVAQEEIDALKQFIDTYGDQKIFYLLRSEPLSVNLKLLSLDNDLKLDAKKRGKDFVMPILSSTTELAANNAANNSNDLKQNLINALLTKEVLDLTTKSAEKIRGAITTYSGQNKDFLKQYLSDKAGTTDELLIFATPAGQAFFYWLYNALNFDILFAQNPKLIHEVDAVKRDFARYLGNPGTRAYVLKQKLLEIDSKLLFAQETDKNVIDALTTDKTFLPLKKEFQDAVVLLQSDFWEPDYQVISFGDYAGYKEGRLSAVLARQKDTQQLFLLVSGHGHAKDTADGRQQLKLAVQKSEQLSKEREEDIFLIIGVDANTKSKKDVAAFKDALRELGLVATNVGPTTVKMRMITAQNDKAAKPALDEEDYVIVKEGQLFLGAASVGFGAFGAKVDPAAQLPNMDNQSDHYAVSVIIRNKAAAGKEIVSPLPVGATEKPKAELTLAHTKTPKVAKKRRRVS